MSNLVGGIKRGEIFDVEFNPDWQGRIDEDFEAVDDPQTANTLKQQARNSFRAYAQDIDDGWFQIRRGVQVENSRMRLTAIRGQIADPEEDGFLLDPQPFSQIQVRLTSGSGEVLLHCKCKQHGDSSIDGWSEIELVSDESKTVLVDRNAVEIRLKNGNVFIRSAVTNSEVNRTGVSGIDRFATNASVSQIFTRTRPILAAGREELFASLIETERQTAFWQFKIDEAEDGVVFAARADRQVIRKNTLTAYHARSNSDRANTYNSASITSEGSRLTAPTFEMPRWKIKSTNSPIGDLYPSSEQRSDFGLDESPAFSGPAIDQIPDTFSARQKAAAKSDLIRDYLSQNPSVFVRRTPTENAFYSTYYSPDFSDQLQKVLATWIDLNAASSDESLNTFGSLWPGGDLLTPFLQFQSGVGGQAEIDLLASRASQPQPWKGGGVAVNERPFRGTEISIRLLQNDDFESIKIRCDLAIRYSTTNQGADATRGIANVFPPGSPAFTLQTLTLDKLAIKEVDGDWQAIRQVPSSYDYPLSRAPGNQPVPAGAGTNAMLFRNGSPIGTFGLFSETQVLIRYEKTVPRWNGAPPTVSFGADEIVFQSRNPLPDLVSQVTVSVSGQYSMQMGLFLGFNQINTGQQRVQVELEPVRAEDFAITIEPEDDEFGNVAAFEWPVDEV